MKIMLNAGKIRLMTDLAIYEKRNGSSVFKINNFYKSDYIIGHLIASFARYTLCALLLMAAAFFFQTDVLFARINEEGFSGVFTEMGILYGAGLLAYLLITYWVCSARYKKAKRGTLLYATKLKRLSRKYCGVPRRRDAEQ